MDTKEIRKSLKEKLGYNASQVSVSSRRGGYDNSLTFTIRDAAVNYDKVEEFSNSLRSVSVCGNSGDILCGGNRYTNVRISDEVENIWAAKYLPKLLEITDQLNENTGISVAHYVLFKERHSTVKVSDTRNHNYWFPMNYHIGNPKSIAIDMYIADLNRKVYRIIAHNPSTGQRLSWNFETQAFYCHDQFDKNHMLVGKTTYQIQMQIEDAMKRLTGYICETIEATDIFLLFDKGLEMSKEIEASRKLQKAAA